MINSRVPLRQVSGSYMDLYISDRSEWRKEKDLVLVVPGGGYFFCNEREAECVALAFCSFGFNSAVLNYSTGEEDFYPVQLSELAMAIDYIKKNNLSRRVYICGFSAGGHLAASIAVLGGEEDCLRGFDTKVDGIILSYPVLLSGEFENKRTLDNLCGDNTSLREKMNLVDKINSNLPPFFIWHTYEDEAVLLENTLFFANGLRKAGVPFEYHVFQHGAHALSLATDSSARDESEINEHVATWFKMAIMWLKELGK